MDRRVSRTIREWPCKQLPVTVIVILLILSPLSRCNPILQNPSEVLVRDQPFANNLSDSCRHSSSIDSIPDSNFRDEIVTNLLKKIQQLRKFAAEKIINENTENICSSSDYGNLSNTPTLSSLQSVENKTALLQIQRSLLVHSSNIYFVRQQLDKYNHTNCRLGNSSTIELLKNRIGVLSASILNIACDIQLIRISMNDQINFTQLINELLDSKLIDHSLCSRRITHECQTIKSSYKLLETVHDYINSIFVL